MTTRGIRGLPVLEPVPGTAPHLNGLLDELSQLLDKGEAESACHTLQRTFEFLAGYFAGVTAAAAARLDPDAPDLSPVLEEDLSALQPRIREALAVLLGSPEAPFSKLLCRVFYVGMRNPLPRRHTRLLGIGGGPIPGHVPLAEWCGLELAGRGPCRRELLRYVPVLAEWLTGARTFFEAAEHELGSGEVMVKIEGVEVSFPLAPPRAVAPSEAAPGLNGPVVRSDTPPAPGPADDALPAPDALSCALVEEIKAVEGALAVVPRPALHRAHECAAADAESAPEAGSAEAPAQDGFPVLEETEPAEDGFEVPAETEAVEAAGDEPPVLEETEPAEEDGFEVPAETEAVEAAADESPVPVQAEAAEEGAPALSETGAVEPDDDEPPVLVQALEEPGGEGKARGLEPDEEALHGREAEPPGDPAGAAGLIAAPAEAWEEFAPAVGLMPEPAEAEAGAWEELVVTAGLIPEPATPVGEAAPWEELAVSLGLIPAPAGENKAIEQLSVTPELLSPAGEAAPWEELAAAAGLIAVPAGEAEASQQEPAGQATAPDRGFPDEGRGEGTAALASAALSGRPGASGGEAVPQRVLFLELEPRGAAEWENAPGEAPQAARAENPAVHERVLPLELGIKRSAELEHGSEPALESTSMAAEPTEERLALELPRESTGEEPLFESDSAMPSPTQAARDPEEAPLLSGAGVEAREPARPLVSTDEGTPAPQPTPPKVSPRPETELLEEGAARPAAPEAPPAEFPEVPDVGFADHGLAALEAEAPPLEALPAETPDTVDLELADEEPALPEAGAPPSEAPPAEIEKTVDLELADEEPATPEAEAPPLEALPAETPDTVDLELADEEPAPPEAGAPPLEAPPAETPKTPGSVEVEPAAPERSSPSADIPRQSAAPPFAAPRTPEQRPELRADLAAALLARRQIGEGSMAVVQECLSFLVSQFRGRRALVVLKDTVDGNLVIRAAHGLEPQDSAPADLPMQILRHARSRGKSILVLDTQKDTNFKSSGSGAEECRSALCVPLVDGGHRVIGFLYSDDLAAGTYSYADLNEAARVGREQGRNLERARKQDALRPRAAPASASASRPTYAVPRQLLAGGVLLMVALLWGFVGMLLSGQERKPVPKSPRTVTTVQSATPVTVSGSFLGALNRRQPEQAYELLSTRLQKRLSPQRFQAAVEDFLKSDVNRWDLAYRKVEDAGGAEGSKARVQVTHARNHGKSWRWYLLKEEHGWRLDRFEGGPLDEAAAD